MIKPDDFDVTISDDERGTVVRIQHIPTGNVRVAQSVADGAVGAVRDRLISELRGLLYQPDEVRVDVGRSEGGDFLRVVHVPTGIQRSAMRRESSTEELLDLVLEDLHSRESS